MKTAISFALLLAAFGLPVVTVSTASSPGVRPEDVGLSSERLQRVSQMIQRRIAAGDLAGAVVVVARKGTRRVPQRARRDGSRDEAADDAGQRCSASRR